MKAWRVFLVWAALVPGVFAWGADPTPGELAGFSLGAPASRFKDRLRMETAVPVRYAESMKEAEARPMPGIRAAVVSFGGCASDGLVNRVKVKYEDSSPGFFDQLLRRYTDRFGKPGEWRGDPFHVVVAWKWSFTDANGHSVSLILQHNTEDKETKTGNCAKLTDWTLYNQEVECFKAAHPSRKEPGRALEDPWEIFLPK